MTRVLLINPPTRHRIHYGEIGLYAPAGLLQLAAAVAGLCELRIFDALYTDYEHAELRGETLAGSSFERIRAEIEQYRPELVGISACYSSNAGLAKIIGHLCREVDPAIKVVIGGPDASVRYALFLESGCCDLCVLGEGEVPFREIVERCRKRLDLRGIRGTAWLGSDGVECLPGEFIADLDALPLPAYEAIDLPAYLAHPRMYKGRGLTQQNSLSLFTSRGCPYSCNFCSIHLHMGRRYRFNSPAYVLRHLDHLIDRYSVSHFHFEDDNLTLVKPRFHAILDGLEERGVTWEASNGIRVDSLDPPLLERMKECGFTSAYLPIESGCQRVLTDIIEKDLSLEKIEEVARHAHALGMCLSAFYIIGFPGETRDEMKQTLDLSLRFEQEYGIAPILLFANPILGTRLYETCVEEGLIHPSLGYSDYPPPTPAVLDEPPIFLPREVSAESLRELLDGHRRRARHESPVRRARAFVRERVLGRLRRLLSGPEGEPARATEGSFELRFGRLEGSAGTRVGLGKDLTSTGLTLLTNESLEPREGIWLEYDVLERGEVVRRNARVESIERMSRFPTFYYFNVEVAFI